MPPEDDDPDETDDTSDETPEEDDDPGETNDTITAANDQKLVRLPRRRLAPPEPVTARRRRRPAPRANPEPAIAAPVTTPAPPPTPTAPPVPPAAPAARIDSNVLLVFEETVKLFPAVAQTIAVDRKTGTPANWMLFERPRTANELYAALKKLHGRSGETTYEIRFMDGAGHGSVGLISMPSTLDELPVPGAPQPAMTPPYAAPYAAPPPYAAAPPVMQPPASGTPFDAMLAMQKQMFDMMLAMQPKPATAAAPATAATPPAAAPDATTLLTMQRQMFDMMQQMQAAVAGHPPASQPQVPPAAPTPPPAQTDQATTLLTMQKQMFEMMQAMQAAAAGRAPAQPATPPFATAPQPTDSTAAMLTMQKQMFDMMLTMMQTAQRGIAGPPPPPGGPYYRPRYGGPAHDPNAPHQPPYGPPQRPQTPSEQLREAASVFRDFRRVADELGFGAGQAADPSPEPDDSPVRVIDMGPAKGVINQSDGSLRGFETVMANLPDILNWVGKQRAEIRRETEEIRQRKQQRRLPPGYVEVTPDYVPPEGFVAVPVDQIPPAAQESLPEPPAEMPPPIEEPQAPPKRAWGMPEVPR